MLLFHRSSIVYDILCTSELGFQGCGCNRNFIIIITSLNTVMMIINNWCTLCKLLKTFLSRFQSHMLCVLCVVG